MAVVSRLVWSSAPATSLHGHNPSRELAARRMRGTRHTLDTAETSTEMPLGRADTCLRQRPRSGAAASTGAVVSAANPGEMIREDALSRDVLIRAINRRMSCLAALDISCLTRRTSLRLFIGRTFLEKFQWRNKHGISYPQDTVHTTNMPKLVGIREVPAIPRDEKVASMKRGCCQVKGITLRIIRHDFVGDVCIHDLGDGLIQVDERQISDQRESRVAVRKIPGSQFGIDGQARHQLIDACASSIEPPPRPVAAGDHLRFRPHLVVETGDRGFDVNAGHTLYSIVIAGTTSCEVPRASDGASLSALPRFCEPVRDRRATTAANPSPSARLTVKFMPREREGIQHTGAVAADVDLRIPQ